MSSTIPTYRGKSKVNLDNPQPTARPGQTGTAPRAGLYMGHSAVLPDQDLVSAPRLGNLGRQVLRATRASTRGASCGATWQFGLVVRHGSLGHHPLIQRAGDLPVSWDEVVDRQSRS